MAEITKETIITQGAATNQEVNTPTTRKATNTQTIGYIIYFIFGIVEVLLAFRLVLKFMGASLSSGFVSLIYGLTGILVAPFEGIFRMWFNQGSETTSILEPATIIALIVYVILAWGIVKLLSISSGEQQEAD